MFRTPPVLTVGVCQKVKTENKIKTMITITVELNKEYKEIQLLECLQSGSGNWLKFSDVNTKLDLSNFKSFELNESYKIRGKDLIFATTQDDILQIWLGHWNDGMA